MSFNTSNIIKAIIAGFIATLALTALMIMKKTMGVMPNLDPIHMLAGMVAEKLGISTNLTIGWIMHFVIGAAVWGSAFAIFNKLLPSKSQVIKGITLGVIAWLLMMIGFMPISGAGLFGLNLGLMGPVVTLILHLVYGYVLGVVYAKLIAEK